MELLACRLHLHGFLTFSSFTSVVPYGNTSFTEYKPAPVIHNYPLMYAFFGLVHGSLASKVRERPIEDAVRVAPPDYRLLKEVLRKLYVFPAKPYRLITTKMLAVAGGERLVQLVPKPKAMYPWRVVHQYFAPGSIFDTILLVYDEDYIPPKTIRLGVKRYGVFRVECVKANIVGEWHWYSDPVNVADIEKWGYTIVRQVTVLSPKKGTAEIARVILNKPVKRIEALFTEGRVEFKVPLPPNCQ